MKMKNLQLIVVASLVFISISCGNEVKEEETEKKETVVTTEKPETHEDIEDKLHLHGDSKWEVSEHMVAHIASVDSMVNNYNPNSETSPNELAQAVDEKLKMLTESCDMTGEAHAQLHLWLLPFWNLVDQLLISSDPVKQSELIKEMTTSLETYHSFFE